MHTVRRAAPTLAAAAALALAACAVGGGGAAPAPESAQQQPESTTTAWSVKTAYQVDLWLHGYAMLQNDTTLVPYFRRGYRDRMAALEQRANVYADLERERAPLRSRLAAEPVLVGGQFLPLYFGSWADLQRGIQIFLQANGNPRGATDQQTQRMIATIAASFPSAGDREWLRQFTQMLSDESTRFYQSYWNAQQRDRRATLAAVDSLWRRVYFPKFAGFLNNTEQRGGEILLSLPLDGEGRTITAGNLANEVAVGFPDSPAQAGDAICVFAHEAAGTIANQVVSDNTTPAEKRAGTADRYTSAAAVRGGALLIQRVAPELLDRYERYYLSSANVPASGQSVAAAFTRTFPLPQPILDGLARQLGSVLSGI